MKDQKICELETSGAAQGFFIVKSIDVRKAKNGSFFADLTLGDTTGEINAKIWDADERMQNIFAAGSLVKVRGEISLWKGIKQLTVKKIRKAVEDDGHDIGDFVQSAPESFESMYGEVLGYIEKIADPGLKEITGYLLRMAKEKLEYYPAAKSNHHAIRTGLLYHVLTMLRAGEKLSSVYARVDRGLLFAGIIIHDLAKTTEMDSDDLGIVSDYTREGKLLGHIIQGIGDIDRAGEVLETPKETVTLLKHMVLSHHYQPEFGSPRKPMIPEAELLHYLDMIDAKMYDFFNNLDKTEPGGFSERVWTLDNRQVYRCEQPEGEGNEE